MLKTQFNFFFFKEKNSGFHCLLSTVSSDAGFSGRAQNGGVSGFCLGETMEADIQVKSIILTRGEVLKEKEI